MAMDDRDEEMEVTAVGKTEVGTSKKPYKIILGLYLPIQQPFDTDGGNGGRSKDGR